MSASLRQSNAAHDVFLDAAGCSRWLKTVPLINAATAHRALTTRLVALNAVEIDPEERLAIMEALRQPVVYVQSEIARGFSGQPMPLRPEARDAFRAVVALWDQLARGYELCLQGLAGNVFASVTLALQRGLDCIARKMLDHHVAHLVVPASTYASLHRLYRLAEKLQRAAEKVPDPLFQANELTSCTRTWVRALLLDAANPREKRPRQVLLVNRLLERWVPKIVVLAQPPEKPGHPPLYVDLDKSSGVLRTATVDGGVRVLDTTALAKSVAKRIVGLRRGAEPAKLGLPDDCLQPGCEALLVGLYRQWCEVPRRAHERVDTVEAAHVSVGIPSVHYYLSGQPFFPPDNPPTLDGEVYRLKRGISDEAWTIRDESAGGLGLLRPHGLGPGAGLWMDQLILVRTAGRAPLLCSIQWLLETESADLELGTQLLGLSPQAAAVRTEGEPAWRPALFLPASLGKGDSIVLPAGGYAPGQTIDIYTDAIVRWQFGAQLAHGADYERFAVTPAEGRTT
jgi:hypothetical protein